jgi:hypothetical protein
VPIIDNDALSRSTKHISEFKHAGHVGIKVAPSSTAGFEAPGHSKEPNLLHIRKQERRVVDYIKKIKWIDVECILNPKKDASWKTVGGVYAIPMDESLSSGGWAAVYFSFLIIVGWLAGWAVPCFGFNAKS